MHAVVFADGALEAKTARGSSHRLFRKRALSAQTANRTSNGGTRASKSDKRCSYQCNLAIKKRELSNAECLKPFYKNVLPAVARSIF